MRNRTARVLQSVLPLSIVIGRVPLPAADRRVALTFDDGPEPMTPAYLDALEGLGVRASFFVVGNLCARFPDLLGEIVRRGHEVAGHGYTHRRFPLLGPLGLARELRETSALLPPSPLRRPLRGPLRSMVRPPGGEVTIKSLAYCALLGYTTALWSVNSQDYREKDPERVAAESVPDDLAAGDVILLHEGQEWTLQALPLIVRRAQERGFRFCALSELLGSAP